MNRYLRLLLVMATFLCILCTGLLEGVGAGGLRVKMMLSIIELPPGFKIHVYADNVPDARSISVSPSGVVYVGTRQQGKVYAIVADEKENTGHRTLTIADNLETPNGVAFYHGDLYVAETHRILRYSGIESHLAEKRHPQIVFQGLPKERYNGWRSIGFNPEGRLYVSVGAPCNVCERNDSAYASIIRIQPDGGNVEIYASGVRNCGGFDWHPITEELWFTDNGREMLGDDLPPDELNRANTQGLHFGFPYCHGDILADPEFGADQACQQYTAPALNLDPHVAPSGMRFYTGHMFPERYRNQIFIAEHGSWNNSRKAGYRITLVRVENDRAVNYEPFARGWLMDEMAWGRPTDVAVMVDGSLLVSDDQNGVIYRIYYDELNLQNQIQS